MIVERHTKCRPFDYHFPKPVCAIVRRLWPVVRCPKNSYHTPISHSFRCGIGSDLSTG